MESSEESDKEESEEEMMQDEVPEEVRRQRWFSDPMFADLSAEKGESDDEAIQHAEEESDDEAIQHAEEESDDEAIQHMKNKQELPLAVRLQAYSMHS